MIPCTDFLQHKNTQKIHPTTLLRQSTPCNCKVQDVGFKQVLICSLAHTVATGALPGCKGGSLFGSTSVESVEKGEDKLRTPKTKDR